MPLVADIHFDYKLALLSIKGGADKIRINPGNIGGDGNVRKVAEALNSSGIPVRVGSQTGSIEKEFLKKYGRNEISLGESALKNVAVLEKYGVKECWYGHIHGPGRRAAKEGIIEGINYTMVSADHINFRPIKIID